MTTLSDHQWDKLSDALLHLYAHGDLIDFPARMLMAVRTLVACDSAAYEELNYARRRTVGVMDPLDSRPGNMDVFERYMAQHPCVARWDATRAPEATAISDLQSRADFHAGELYNEFYRPANVEDQLTLLVGSRQGVLVGVALNRSRRGFAADEVALLDAVRPHVLHAYRNAALLTPPGDGDPLGVIGAATRDLPAIEVDGLGRILRISGAAERWLDRRFPHWRRNHSTLPADLWERLSQTSWCGPGPQGDHVGRGHLPTPGNAPPHVEDVRPLPLADGHLLLMIRPHAVHEGRSPGDWTSTTSAPAGPSTRNTRGSTSIAWT